MYESTFDLSTMQSKLAVPGKKKTLTIVIVCNVMGQENNGTTIAAISGMVIAQKKRYGNKKTEFAENDGFLLNRRNADF